MLQLGDQLDLLEKLLREGDLEQAAAELEQLANMIENMMDSINNAEEEYGGERYAEMRKQLGEFAQQFKELENEQQALAERAQNMLSEYRNDDLRDDRVVETHNSGKQLGFVRQHTQQVVVQFLLDGLAPPTGGLQFAERRWFCVIVASINVSLSYCETHRFNRYTGCGTGKSSCIS